MRTKTLIRLFIEDATNLALSVTVALSQAQSHYLANVMRLKAGDTVALFNGKDGEWSAEITEAHKRAVTLKIMHQTKEQIPEPDLWLVFAPIKKARLDFIAQKATELGASHLQPVYTQRTIVDRVKEERLQANAVEAAEQCERLTVPTVADPVKLDKLLDTWPDERKIMFCDEDLSGVAAHDALRSAETKGSVSPWAIFIGPEGGFTDEERARIKAHPNTVVVALGPRILRADTAAMSALALWQSALGDW
ncbi:16S rRNA (uracil(1498)-N(3))-methyltransferase [Kordiimonas pumila]|uniref:Ribosomal RNA small subunit methyltransferase E n=1 Tax=Kordiimonas pumila TaxID=2161677 RepID=A0ABV7D900_9PROT|nr:16S rRNA (uracil(1498)-N(3))-methyltransferase [Kordiimonas pumila]